MQCILKVNVGDKAESGVLVVDFNILFYLKNNRYFLWNRSMITLGASCVPCMKMTASLTNLNVHGMDQTGKPSFCPPLSSFIIAKELPYDVEQSESKVLHMVVFHIDLHSHVSVFRWIKGGWIVV